LERDYIIRIILEAQDRMSKTMKQATADAKREMRELEAEQKKATREAEKRARAEEVLTREKLRTDSQRIKSAKEVERQAALTAASETRAAKTKANAEQTDAVNAERLAREKIRTETAKADAVVKGVVREGRAYREGITQRNAVERETKRQAAEAIAMERQRLRSLGGLRGKLTDLVRGYESATKSGERYTRQQVQQENALFRLARNFKQGDTNAKIFSGRFLLLGPLLYTAAAAAYAFGAQLVSIGASAVYAAGALGGMAAALVAQVLPAVGLLAAAFHRVTTVMQAVTAQQALQRQQLGAQHKDAAQAKDDAWALAKAHQAVSDAMYDQVRAHKDLADARRNARRDIVDAINAETDANLNLRDAELSLLEAKENLRQEKLKAQGSRGDAEDARLAVKEAQQRLAQAKSRKDTNEILNAESALDFANRNLQNVTVNKPEERLGLNRATLGVAQAQQNLKEAQVGRGRQQDDTARTLKKGVEGSDQVVSALRAVTMANRALSDAQHSVEVAQRKSTDATDAYSAAQRNLDFILKGLSPAERGLYNEIRKFEAIWKKATRPMTDAIVTAFTSALKMVGNLVKDPKIQQAGQAVANALGENIVKFTKFLTGPEMRKNLEFFMHAFVDNAPALESIAESVIKIFAAVARAATPMTHRILVDFANWLEGVAKWASSNKGLDRMERFFKAAGQNLRDWGSLALAIGNLLAALAKGADPSGMRSINGLTDTFNDWAVWLREHPKRVNKFFEDSRRLAVQLFDALVKLGKALAPLFDPENMAAFTTFLTNVFVPALHDISDVLTELLKAFNTLTGIPVLGTLLIWFAEFGVVFALLSKWIPLLRRMKEGITAITGSGLVRWLKNVLTGSKAAQGEKGVVGFGRALEDMGGKSEKTVGKLEALRGKLNNLSGVLKKTTGLSNDFKGGLVGKAGLVGAAFLAGVAIGHLADKYLHLSDHISDAALKLTDFIGLTGSEEKTADSRTRLGAKNVRYIANARNAIQKAHPDWSMDQVKAALHQRFPGKDAGKLIDSYAKGGQIGRAFAGAANGWPGSARSQIIEAHEGEWIMNPPQIKRLGDHLGLSVDSLRNMIFGRNTAHFGDFNFTGKLRDITDSFGKVVHFAQLAGGQYGQVGANWANKIERRAYAHNLLTGGRPFRKHMGKFGSPAGFARGGIVGARMPTFAAGGVVTKGPSGQPSKTINQNFTINTSEVNADADYVMRVGAQHAQEAF
jgi:hypothetical protein